MKLLIRKNQADKKGLFGGNKGVNFSLEYKVNLTPEEDELIKKYKVENEVLMTSKDNKTTTILDLLRGESLVTQNIDVLLNNEQVAIDVCRKFKNYLDVLRSFGGDYILEIRSDGVYNTQGEKIR